MKTIIKLLLFCFAILTYEYSIAQDRVIVEFDPVTQQPVKPIPFDVPLTFKIPIESEPISVILIKYSRKKEKVDSVTYNLANNNTFFFVEKEKKYIIFNYGSDALNSCVSPYQHIKILLSYPDPKLFKKLDSKFRNVSTDTLNSEIQENENKAVLDLVNSIDNEFFIPIDGTKNFNLSSKPDFIESVNYYNNLSAKFQELHKIEDTILESKLVGDLLKLDLQCLCDAICNDTCLISSDNRTLISTTLSSVINGLSKKNLALTSTGLTTLLGPITADCDNVEFETRKKNFISSLKEINEIKSYLALLSLCESAECIKPILEFLTKLELELTRKICLISEYEELKIEITHIAPPIHNSILATSSIIDLKSASAFWITPDIGMAYYGFDNNFWGITPYAGIEISPRPINKNIPIRRYSKKPHCLLSFSLAYTLTPLKAENKRADFFKDGSLMSGFGLRLSRVVRINAGGLWFYADNPNPVISTKKLQATPYVGLSIDASITDLINGFNNLKTTIIK